MKVTTWHLEGELNEAKKVGVKDRLLYELSYGVAHFEAGLRTIADEWEEEVRPFEIAEDGGRVWKDSPEALAAKRAEEKRLSERLQQIADQEYALFLTDTWNEANRRIQAAYADPAMRDGGGLDPLRITGAVAKIISETAGKVLDKSRDSQARLCEGRVKCLQWKDSVEKRHMAMVGGLEPLVAAPVGQTFYSETSRIQHEFVLAAEAAGLKAALEYEAEQSAEPSAEKAPSEEGPEQESLAEPGPERAEWKGASGGRDENGEGNETGDTEDETDRLRARIKGIPEPDDTDLAIARHGIELHLSWSTSELKRLREMKKRGRSYADIARKYGLTRAQVVSRIRDSKKV